MFESRGDAAQDRPVRVGDGLGRAGRRPAARAGPAQHRGRQGGPADLALTRVWSDPARGAGPLLDWGDPDLVYLTYGKIWLPVFLAFTLCAFVVRRRRQPPGFEKWAWRIALIGYVLRVRLGRSGLLDAAGPAYNALLRLAFLVGLPGVLLTDDRLDAARDHPAARGLPAARDRRGCSPWPSRSRSSIAAGDVAGQRRAAGDVRVRDRGPPAGRHRATRAHRGGGRRAPGVLTPDVGHGVPPAAEVRGAPALRRRAARSPYAACGPWVAEEMAATGRGSARVATASRPAAPGPKMGRRLVRNRMISARKHAVRDQSSAVVLSVPGRKSGGNRNPGVPRPVAASSAATHGPQAACGGLEARRRGASHLDHRDAGAPRTPTTGTPGRLAPRPPGRQGRLAPRPPGNAVTHVP